MDLKTKIGVGSVQFGLDYGISNSAGKTDLSEVVRILNYLPSQGISTIDTALNYGTAEATLGNFDLSNLQIVSKFIINDEFPTVSACLTQSLKNLRQTSLYAYLAHRPEQVLSSDTIWNELKLLKKENKIEKIGFSLNEPAELEALFKAKMLPDIVQVPFNYFDQRFKAFFHKLKSINCEVHTRSSFLQGLFFVEPDKLGAHFKDVKDLIGELQIQYGKSLPSVLLNFVLSEATIDRVIVGVENLEQLKDNIKNLNKNVLENIDIDIKEDILMPYLWR